MKALIDGDILVYMIGFSAERDGQADLNQAKLNLRTTLSQYKQYITKYFPSVKEDDFSLFLTSDDKSNFRFNLAKTQTYKGNRKSSSKPILYDEIRQLLQDKYDAIMVHGQEADDEMSIRSSKSPNKHVIVSKDKDLRMVPGWHWEMDVTKPPYFTDDVGVLLIQRQAAGRSKVFGTGIKWFYFQCLIGDRVDNIPGIPKVGDLTAYSILKDVNTPEELHQVVLDKYIKSGLDEERLNEVKSLLWMRRERK